jgi:hypothetical protein
MKRFDFHEIVLLFLSIGLLTIMLFGMSGCSANYHLNKFQDKGGVCGKIDTIRVTKYDTITNTYYHFDSLVVVNDRVVPLTRTEIRYMDRVRHDTLNHKETIIKYVEKEKTKREKQERKTKTAPWKIGIVILALIALIVFLLKFR